MRQVVMMKEDIGVSVALAKDFIAKMKDNEQFARQVMNCSDGKARMEFVRAAGFDFTPGELKEASCELTDAELDEVAGGSAGECFFNPGMGIWFYS